MEGLHWFLQYWLDFLQSVSIVAGLLFTGVSMRREEKARRTGNLISITQHHREIWNQVFVRPELSRILHPEPDLNRVPITTEEKFFVRFLILHLNTVFRALTDGVLLRPDALERDVKSFFSLPIPLAVWRELKEFQDQDFIEFVENACQ